MRTKDSEALQSAYDTYARDILDRTMVVPAKQSPKPSRWLAKSGSPVRKKPEEIYDNSFVNNLEKDRLYEADLGQRELSPMIGIPTPVVRIRTILTERSG